jgi:hypothetical protein
MGALLQVGRWDTERYSRHRVTATKIQCSSYQCGLACAWAALRDVGFLGVAHSIAQVLPHRESSTEAKSQRSPVPGQADTVLDDARVPRADPGQRLRACSRRSSSARQRSQSLVRSRCSSQTRSSHSRNVMWSARRKAAAPNRMSGNRDFQQIAAFFLSRSICLWSRQCPGPSNSTRRDA